MRTEPSPMIQGHGVYALVHIPTKRVYIGSSTDLRNRAHEWKAALSGKRKPLYFEVGDPADWVMRVLKRTEGLTHQEIRDVEAKAIENARAKGLNVINKQAPATKAAFMVDGLTGSATFHATRLGKTPAGVIKKLKRGYTIEQALGLVPPPPPRKSVIDCREDWIASMAARITHEGKAITYDEAAKLTGRSVDAIKSRVRVLRKRDPSLEKIPVEDLRVS